MSDIRDPRWQTASQSLQPRPRVRTGSMAAHSTATAQPSESRPYSSMTNAREKVLHNHLKSRDVQRRNQTTSAYVSLGQDLMDQKNDAPVYEHSDKPSHSKFRYDYLATPNSPRHLPANVYNRNTAQPIYDGQVGMKDARSADDGRPPRPKLLPRRSVGGVRGVSGKTETSSPSSAFTTRMKGRLKRDYTAFDTYDGPRRDVIYKAQASCKACAVSKVKCSKEIPTCHRCLQMATACSYDVLRKHEKPGPQQGQEIQPEVQPSPASYILSPEMQNAQLPGSPRPGSIGEPQSAYYPPNTYFGGPALSPPELQQDPKVDNQQMTPRLWRDPYSAESPPPGIYNRPPDDFPSNEKFRLQQELETDDIDNQARTIVDQRESSSTHQIHRGKLSYTISEDRTMDASMRYRACFLALGQRTRRVTEFEPHADRRIIFINRDDSNRLLNLLKEADRRALISHHKKT